MILWRTVAELKRVSNTLHCFWMHLKVVDIRSKGLSRQDWTYTNNHDYGNLFTASGTLCDGTAGNVNVLYIV